MSNSESLFTQPIDIDATIKSIKFENVGDLCYWTAVFDSNDYTIEMNGAIEEAEFVAKLFINVNKQKMVQDE